MTIKQRLKAARHFLDRLLHFLMVGGAATTVHWSVMYSLIQLSFNAAMATAIGAAAGFILAYWGHARFTFSHTSQPDGVFLRFVLMAALGWLVNLGLFIGFTIASISIPVAQLISTAGATLCNYIVSKQFVFNSGYRHES